MFHALMETFQLELFNFIAYFSNVVPLTSCVFFLVGIWPVENVALTTKGLQKRKQLVSGTTVEK